MLRQRLIGQLMPAVELRGLLLAAGCPTTPEEIGLDRARLKASYAQARQIRSRYTIFDLAAEAGCQHQCIYCDSRSECYQIENFADVLVKVNAIDLLKKELPRKRVKGAIGTGSMSDPYLPLEATRRLTA